MESNNQNDFLRALGDSYNEAFFADADNTLKQTFDQTGILLLSNFISAKALTQLQQEAATLKTQAYRSTSSYNVYVMPDDNRFTPTAPRNRKFTTTKGCIPADQIPPDSILRVIYEADLFRKFICRLQDLSAIYPYADTLSSININYYDPGDSLEWHFDNADFAITLLIQQCTEGGVYEYVPNMRYDETGRENYNFLEKILDGKIEPQRTKMTAGDLMLFRGNRSLHRVTNIRQGNRVLVTLNYNVKPGIPLSEKSRLTFFGRI